jgi:hypothetical protein
MTKKKKKKDSYLEDAPTRLVDLVDEATLKEIEERWLEGWDANKIAATYDKPLKLVNYHIKSELVNKHSSRFERLGLVFDQLFSASELAFNEFLKKPSQTRSMAYSSIVNALRGALVDLDAIQNNAELADDLIKLVINPLIRKVTNILIEELGNFKEDLMLRFGEEEADRIVNDVTVKLGSRFSSLLEDTGERLENVLTVRDKNRKKTLNGKGKKGSKSHLKLVQGGTEG